MAAKYIYRKNSHYWQLGHYASYSLYSVAVSVQRNSMNVKPVLMVVGRVTPKKANQHGRHARHRWHQPAALALRKHLQLLAKRLQSRAKQPQRSLLNLLATVVASISQPR